MNVKDLTTEGVLREFVRDIEDTGGLEAAGHRWVPSACTSWSDLAVTYIHACQVLGLEPKKGAPGGERQMKCDTCGMPFFWPSAQQWAESGPTTCPGCQAIIIAHAVPDDESECVEPYDTGIAEEPRMPEDEDLVTKDYVEFYRVGFSHRGPCLTVLPRTGWQEAVKRYMDFTQYWPNVWLEEDRGGHTNISLEIPADE